MFTYQYENGKYQIFHRRILFVMLDTILCYFCFGFLVFWCLCQCVCAMYYEFIRFFFASLILSILSSLTLVHTKYDWKEYIIIACLCCIYDFLLLLLFGTHCVCVCFAFIVVVVDATAAVIQNTTTTSSNSSSRSSSSSICSECPLLLFKMQVTDSKQLLSFFFIWCEFFCTQYIFTVTFHVLHSVKKKKRR